MASKEFPLSIVISTVDKATAGIAQLNARLKTITDPLKALNKEQDDLNKGLGTIWKNFGGPQVVGGFQAVGAALSDIISKVALLAVGAGAAALAFKSVVDELDNLGDAADRIGVTATELAGLRFAAGQSGASIEALDEGLLTFSKNLGLARAGTGRMAKQLEKISPALLRQVKAAKTNQEAIGLVANAFTKLKDPAKKAGLAAATGLGAELVPLLSTGAKGVKELTDEFEGLSGNIEPGVKVAGDLDNMGRRLGATWLGVKAQIIAGVGPPVLGLLKELVDWAVKNRDEIGKWAAELGTKIPKVIEEVRSKFNDIVSVGKKVWDVIDGLSGAVKILATLMVGKLVLAIGSLSIALLTTPFGWVIISLAAIAAGAVAIITNWDKVSGFFSDLWLGIKQSFADAWEFIQEILGKITGAVKDAVEFLSGEGVIKWITGGSQLEAMRLALEPPKRTLGIGPTASDVFGPPALAKSQQTRLQVDFANAPKGTRVSTDPRSTGDVDLSVGFSMVTP